MSLGVVAGTARRGALPSQVPERPAVWQASGAATRSQFGEQGARLTYGSYLRLEQLLTAQHLESDAAARTTSCCSSPSTRSTSCGSSSCCTRRPRPATRCSRRDEQRLWWAQHLLQRMHVIERVLVQQVDVLETMTPAGLPAVPAGAGAGQRLPVGAVPRAGVPLRRQGPVVRARGSGGSPTTSAQRLQRRLDEPTPVGRVPAACWTPRAAGRRRRAGHRRRVRRAAHDRSTYADVWALAEALLQHDELAAAWRARHVVMVERMIGTKTGTGGSLGRGVPPQPPGPALLPAAVGAALGAVTRPVPGA